MSDIAVSRPMVEVVVVGYTDAVGTVEIMRWLSDLVTCPDLAADVSATLWDNRSHGLKAGQGPVRYISSPAGNVGFGAAVNGATASSTSDRLLLLNYDVDLDRTQFAAIIDRLALLSGQAIWAPTLVNPDGTSQTGQGSLYLRTGWQEVVDIWGRPARRQRTDPRMTYLRGAVLSIGTAEFQKAGGFDEQFFLYGEEADLCFRLPDHVRDLDDDIRVVHHGSAGRRGKSPAALRHSLNARVLIQRRYNGRTAAAATWMSARLYLAALILARRLRAVES